MVDRKEEELLENLEAHAVRVRSLREYCTNEEQTKISLINPYLEILGFDVRDPRYVRLEFTADFAKGTERVDYALMNGENPILLVEAKSAVTNLDDQVSGQLQRYAMGLTSVNYAAITNGITWKWYAKSGGIGCLDESPFLVHDATDPKQREVRWLSSLRNDPSQWGDIAVEESLQSRILEWFSRQRTDPDESFKKLITNSIGERATSKNTEAIGQLWLKTISTYIQQEIDKALLRARGSNEISEPSPINDDGAISEVVDASVEVNETESIALTTAKGTVTLSSSKLARAWRVKGEENWRIAGSMTTVCIEILQHLADLHDGGPEVFFTTVSTVPKVGNYFELNEKIPAHLRSRWTEVNSRWGFFKNLNNDRKVARMKEVAPFCIENGRSVDFDSKFEIWNPTPPPKWRGK